MKNTQKGFIVPLLIIIIAVLVVGGGFYVYSLNKTQKLKTDDNETKSNQVVQDFSSEEEIVSQFKNAKYRIVRILDLPDYPNTLYIATEKSQQMCGSVDSPSRCSNDMDCGSIYTSPTCFFFTEPKFEVGSNVQSVFVGSLKSQGVIDHKSATIKDKRYLFFTTADGEGGNGYSKDWKLDLETGKFDLLNEKTFTNPDYAS